MFNWILTLLLAGNALATTPAIQLETLDNLIGADVDFSPNQKNFTFQLNYQSHSLNTGVLLKDSAIRNNTFLFANYSYNLKFANFASNEIALGWGYLDSGYTGLRTDGNRLFITEALIGARNDLHFSFGRKEHTKIKIGASAAKEILDEENNWDNWAIGAQIQNQILKIYSNLQLGRKFFNPNRYWFVNKKNYLDYKIGPQFSFGNFQLMPFSGWEYNEADQDTFRNLLHGGVTASLKTASGKIWQSRFMYGIDRALETKTMAISLGSNFKPSPKSQGGTWEIFWLNRNGDPWKKESVIGAKITVQTLNFLKGSANPPKLFSPYDYRAADKQSDFYPDYGYQDDANLNIYEQTSRLNSLRLRNEWSGRNLGYFTAGLPVQMPIDVYGRRFGDCDDQAFLNAWMDRKNGYRSYLLSYWAVNEGPAHAIEIIQDPKTGRWFIDEYGLLHEIKVGPNAPLDTVMWEALKQGARFSALPLEGPEALYWVDEPTDDPAKIKRVGPTYVWRHDFQSTLRSRPRLERGYELFAGPDALWR